MLSTHHVKVNVVDDLVRDAAVVLQDVVVLCAGCDGYFLGYGLLWIS